MINQVNLLTKEDYSNLPIEYYGFNRPEWGGQILIPTNGKNIDLNSGNIMNLAYSNIAKSDSIFSSELEAPTYLNVIEGFLNLAKLQEINIAGKDIDFFGEVWDFSEFAKKTQAKAHYIFRFSEDINELNDYYDIVLRLFLFYSITEKGIGKTSIHQTFMDVKNALKCFYKLNLYNLRNLTVSDLKEFIERESCIYTTRYKNKVSLKHFLSSYSLIIENIYDSEINSYLNDVDRSLVKAITEENKTPLLPSAFFNQLELVLNRTFYSETHCLKERMVCGLILIDMQTGLRPSELVNLEKNSLSIWSFEGKKVGTLSYSSAKGRGQKEHQCSTIATTKTIEVFKKLVELDLGKSHKLLVFDEDGKRIKHENFQSHLRKICIDNCVELGIINQSSPEKFKFSLSVTKTMHNGICKIKPPSFLKLTDTLSIPSMTQFRVYFASEWRERGVNDREISSMLGHSSYEMWGYYARSAREIEEEKVKVNAFLSDMIDNTATVLGEKGEAFQKKIDEFLIENNYNTKRNVEEIIVDIKKIVEIRVKNLGYCVRSNSKRTCEYDSNTDDFICSYGFCSNHCHTYYTSPITYSLFCEVIRIIEYNKENGFLRQVEREMKKLKSIIILELMPELDDLKLQIQKQTETEILRRHPEIENIVRNMDSIYLEIKKWIDEIEKSEITIKGEKNGL